MEVVCHGRHFLKVRKRKLNIHFGTFLTSGGFRPEAGEAQSPRPVLLQAPSFTASHDFLQRTQISDFFAFPKFPKVGKFAASIERPKTKNASVSGGLCPLSPDQGLCPWTPLRALPPDPRYRLALPRSPWGRAPIFCGLEPPLSEKIFTVGFIWALFRV